MIDLIVLLAWWCPCCVVGNFVRTFVMSIFLRPAVIRANLIWPMSCFIVDVFFFSFCLFLYQNCSEVIVYIHQISYLLLCCIIACLYLNWILKLWALYLGTSTSQTKAILRSNYGEDGAPERHIFLTFLPINILVQIPKCDRYIQQGMTP